MKKTGFTLIELLVVIVIIGILSTISTATFKSYFGKARDAERQAAIQNIALMVKVDSADNWGDTKFMYNTASLTTLFATNDFRVPKGQANICYIFLAGNGDASANAMGDNNHFAVATWGESKSTDDVSSAGVLVDGTELAVNALDDGTFPAVSTTAAPGMAAGGVTLAKTDFACTAAGAAFTNVQANFGLIQVPPTPNNGNAVPLSGNTVYEVWIDDAGVMADI